MLAFALVVICYSFLWVCTLYFILNRISTIRKRTEKRVHDFDEGYNLPTFRRPLVLTVLLGLCVYIISIALIVLFLKP